MTATELATAIAAGALLLGTLLPALRQSSQSSGLQESLDNLTVLGIAHHIYAADWNGRQYTQIVDDLASYGDTRPEAFSTYHSLNGGCSSSQDPDCHPPILLGWALPGNLVGYWMNHPGNWGLPQPMVFEGPVSQVGFGSFRIPNAKGFHDYVSGRLYAPEFYAPNDTVPYALVEPLFDLPTEFDQAAGVTDLYWSSYCNSPAAMYNPQVMRHPDDGGWQDPWLLDDSMTSPSLSEATYPSLKTQTIEHHWNQNALPDPCNPAFDGGGTYDGCEPYYFNHSLASQPAALFYDLTVRLLPVPEAIAADAQVMGQTGHGLWSRDTPLGEDGYFSDLAYDVAHTSFHVLTTEGIHGRDTVEGAGAVAPSKSAIQGMKAASSAEAR